jgi:hypothetical protein
MLTVNPGVIINPGVTLTAPKILPPVSAGLQLYLDAGNVSSYPGSGTTWTDLINSKEFTLYNGTSYSSNNGGYIEFDPASEQYAEATSLATGLANWTVEAWHYYAGTNNNTTDGGNSACIVTEIFAGSPINFTLGNCTDSFPNLQVGHWDGSSFYPTPPGHVLTAGHWYHLVGTFDGTAHRLYINGAQVASTETTAPAYSSGVGIRLMRRWDARNYWGGRLSIVRIYDASIGDVGVLQNYKADRERFGL